MKALIVGAGGQGAACAAIMARLEGFDVIKLADMDEAVAAKTAKHINSPKIVTCALDATDSHAVFEAAIGFDIVFDMVLPWMATYVMEGSLKAKAHYVNTAFDTPFWDELLENKELTLHKEFKEAGLTALLGCGMAPGFTNVLARHYANKLDKVTEIRMRIGKKNIADGSNWYTEALQPYNPGWSPKQALVDCLSPSYALENGKFVKYAPFTGLEECDFSDPIGTLPVTHHSHEETYSMPRTFEGLQYCDFKYFMPIAPAVFYACGLLDENEIVVNNTKIKPLDVVVAKITAPSDSFLAQTKEKLEIADKTAFVEMIVEVTGEKDGKKVTYKASCPKMNAPGPKLLDLYGTAMVNVALPAIIGAKLILANPQPGVIFADELDPSKFFDLMKEVGYDYKWAETIT